jgi:hypothetical protein
MTPVLICQDCHIFDINVEAVECSPNGVFWIILDFESRETGHEGFSVLGNGNDYGDFQYEDLPIELGPIEINCALIHEFVVSDNHIDSCSNYVVFESPACCENDCAIEVNNIALGECDSTGYRILQFVVENESPGLSGFDVLFEYGIVAHFEYGNSPYSISVPGYWWADRLVVRDSDYNDCSFDFHFENEDCEIQPECLLQYPNMSINREFVCTSDSTYEAYVTLNYQGPADSLWVHFIEEEDYPDLVSESELVSVNDFPYLLGEFIISGELYTFYVHEQDNAFCMTGGEWNDAPDCSEYDDCSINDLVIEAQECTSGSGEIYVDLAFQVENPESSGFLVRGNGVIYDTFVYGQVYYTVGPILADCETNYEFIVIDVEDADCYAEAYFEEPPCCDANMECEIYDLVVEPGDCHEDGTYTLWIDFEYNNPGNDFFEVYAGNIYIGYYDFDHLPLLIDSFPGRDVMYDIITVCVNDVPECCQTIEFLGPDCDDDYECNISYVFAEAHECTAAGTFYVDVEFDIENPTWNTDVSVNSVSQNLFVVVIMDLVIFQRYTFMR